MIDVAFETNSFGKVELLIIGGCHSSILHPQVLRIKRLRSVDEMFGLRLKECKN